MKFRFTNLDTMEFREYDEKNIKGGAEAAWKTVNALYELRQRKDAPDWFVSLWFNGLDFDFDMFQVTKYAVEVLA